MCGLVGVIGDIGLQEKRAFRDMLMLDYIRGPHSTGVAAIGGGGDFRVAKKVGAPADLFDTKSFDSMMNPLNMRALLGHNRYATKGKINSANAHPFEFEHVVGCHNGTLTSHYNLDDPHLFDVDSEAVMNHINNNGIAETLPELRGAYALTVYDKREQAIYLARNDERPLFYTYADDLETMFYASEEWILKVALGRNGIRHGDIHDVMVGHTYRFAPTGAFKEKLKVTIRKFDMYKPPVVKHGGGGSKVTPLNSALNSPLAKYQGETIKFEVAGVVTTSFHTEYISCGIEEDPKAEVRIYCKHNKTLWDLLMNSTKAFSAKVTSIVTSHPTYINIDHSTVKEVEEEVEFYGFEDEALTEGQWNLLTTGGCVSCKEPAEVVDRDDLMWLNRNTFLCPVCSDFSEEELSVDEQELDAAAIKKSVGL